MRKMQINNLKSGSAHSTNKQKSLFYFLAFLILCWGCYLFSSSFDLSQIQADRSVLLANKYNHTRKQCLTNIHALNSSKINLNSKLQHLKTKYTNLTKLIFSRNHDSKNIFNSHEQLLRYFGENFYHTAINIHKSKINTSDKLIGQNIRTIVTFSKYYAKSDSIDLVIYTEFALKKHIQNRKTGIAYITIKYNLNKNQATNTRFKLATE